MSRPRIAIIHGRVPPDAPEDEQDVLTQVKTVSDSLTALGYEPVAVPVSLDLRTSLAPIRTIQPVCVFNLVESLEGKGRHLPYAASVLQEDGITFTGAHADALLCSSNKLLAKAILFQNGIPTTPWSTCEAFWRSPVPLFSPPYIVKSVWEHASVGLSEKSVFATDHELRSSIQAYPPTERAGLFVEQYVEGREFNISILAQPQGPVVLPAAEIVFQGYAAGRPRIVDYKAKWQADTFEYGHTVRSFEFPHTDAPLIKQLAALTLEVWNAFSMTGYGRVDFRVNADNDPYVLELNTNPCISPDSGFAAAAHRYGLTQEQLIKAVVDDALMRHLRPNP